VHYSDGLIRQAQASVVGRDLGVVPFGDLARKISAKVVPVSFNAPGATPSRFITGTTPRLLSETGSDQEAQFFWLQWCIGCAEIHSLGLDLFDAAPEPMDW